MDYTMEEVLRKMNTIDMAMDLLYTVVENNTAQVEGYFSLMKLNLLGRGVLTLSSGEDIMVLLDNILASVHHEIGRLSQ